MSIQEERDIEKRLRQLIPVLWFLIVGAFGMGGWLATVEYRHRETDEIAKKTRDEIGSFSLWKERTEASRFESKDGIKLQTTMNESVTAVNNLINQQDKRIQKLETANEYIQGSLARIENKLGTN